jgi:hypothetical protein
VIDSSVPQETARAQSSSALRIAVSVRARVDRVYMAGLVRVDETAVGTCWSIGGSPNRHRVVGSAGGFRRDGTQCSQRLQILGDRPIHGTT